MRIPDWRTIRGPLAFGIVLLLAACGEPPAENPAEGTQAGTQEYVDRMAEEHADDTTRPSEATELGEIPPMQVLSEETVYGHIAGKPLTGYLAYPESAHGGLPGILMFPEWWGLNDNIRVMADKLAGQGYVVLALDIYDGEVATTPERARELAQRTMSDPEALNDRIRHAWKFMTEEIGALSVASLGWCMGGTLSFNTALLFPDELAATVIYYGHVSGASREQLATLNMPILGLFGAEDGGIPVEGVRQFEAILNELGKDAQIVIYPGAGHAFANPTGERYQAEVAEDAWQKTLEFLDRSLNAAVNRNVLEESPPSGEQPAPANPR